VKRDTGLELLLELHGTEYTENNGYWYRIEAWIIDSTPERPHGIRYNLTLHDKYNKRILGFDNAHAVKHKKKKKYKGRIVEYDHTHETALDKGTPYEFVNAEQLLQDFFNRLNQILDNLKAK